jgi:hypothetical protein
MLTPTLTPTTTYRVLEPVKHKTEMMGIEEYKLVEVR